MEAEQLLPAIRRRRVTLRALRGLPIPLMAVAWLAPGLAQAPQAPLTPDAAALTGGQAGAAILQLEGKTLRTYEVPEANQGVAAGLTHFFAVDNSTLAKYEIRSGHLIDRWVGVRNGPIPSFPISMTRSMPTG